MLKAGSYANLGVTLKSWTDKKIKKEKMTTTKVLFPLFSELCNHIDDPLWKDIFNKASYGKLPKKFGFSSEGPKLFYKKGNKIIDVLLSHDLGISVKQCRDFFQKMGGIYSSKDQTIRKETESETSTDTWKPKLWSEITNEKFKNILLSNFLSQMKNKLNPEDFIMLNKQLNIANILNMLNDDSIILDAEGDKIKNIKIINPNTLKISFDNLNSKNKIKKTYKKNSDLTPNSLIKLWHKYLKLYKCNKNEFSIVIEESLSAE